MVEVTNKRQMYELLTSGEFGNTIPQYSSVEQWSKSGDPLRYGLWGVRTKTVGGPCRLNCPNEEVAETVRNFSPHVINISVMIHLVGNVTWLGNIWDSPTGLVCDGVEYPPRVHDWRVVMKQPQQWEGIQAINLLKRHLNPNSYDDLMILREKYPNHVYELSALDVCFGIIKGRNAVLWEVRCY